MPPFENLMSYRASMLWPFGPKMKDLKSVLVMPPSHPIADLAPMVSNLLGVVYNKIQINNKNVNSNKLSHTRFKYKITQFKFQKNVYDLPALL